MGAKRAGLDKEEKLNMTLNLRLYDLGKNKLVTLIETEKAG